MVVGRTRAILTATTGGSMSQKRLHMDVMKENYFSVICKMHTHEGSFHFVMQKTDYQQLKRNGFFIDPEPDEKVAGVIATTETFVIE